MPTMIIDVASINTPTLLVEKLQALLNESNQMFLDEENKEKEAL